MKFLGQTSKTETENQDVNAKVETIKEAERLANKNNCIIFYLTRDYEYKNKPKLGKITYIQVMTKFIKSTNGRWVKCYAKRYSRIVRC